MVIHNNFPDFATFLYIHMSHVDHEYHAKEEEMVRAKMKKLLPDTTNAPMASKYQQILNQYHLTKREDVIEIIKASFKHFESAKPSLKLKILSDMLDLINADGKIDKRETATLHELKEIIGALSLIIDPDFEFVSAWHIG